MRQCMETTYRSASPVVGAQKMAVNTDIRNNDYYHLVDKETKAQRLSDLPKVIWQEMEGAWI